MPYRLPFRLNRTGVMLALISAGFAGQAGAAAGRVDFSIGGATVSGTDGRERPLAKGAELDSGDTIRTNDGRAQIRFSDGAYVSLQPNTDFAIKEYRFEGKTDGSERGLFGLTKGAMRTVTGLIGRVNRNRYQITTPTATVGIRGTGGRIEILTDGSTLVAGTSGIWTLSNPAGTIDVPAGISGLAPSKPDTPPQQTTQTPTTSAAPPTAERTTFSTGEERTPTGMPVGLVIPTTPATPAPSFIPLTSGPGYALAMGDNGVSIIPGTGGSPFFGGGRTFIPEDAVFESSGKLTQFTAFGNAATFTLLGSHAPAPETGSDGVLAWGRWIGQVNFSDPIWGSGIAANYSANQGLHYVVGTPTNPLPTAGTFTYNLIGATNPTFANSLTAPGTLNSATLVGNFTTGRIDVNANATAGGLTYIGIATGTTAGGISIPFVPVGGSGSGTGCSVSCGFGVQGLFFGVGATHAGITYTFSGTAQGSNLSGAAALKR